MATFFLKKKPGFWGVGGPRGGETPKNSRENRGFFFFGDPPQKGGWFSPLRGGGPFKGFSKNWGGNRPPPQKRFQNPGVGGGPFFGDSNFSGPGPRRGAGGPPFEPGFWNRDVQYPGEALFPDRARAGGCQTPLGAFPCKFGIHEGRFAVRRRRIRVASRAELRSAASERASGASAAGAPRRRMSVRLPGGHPHAWDCRVTRFTGGAKAFPRRRRLALGG